MKITRETPGKMENPFWILLQENNNIIIIDFGEPLVGSVHPSGSSRNIGLNLILRIPKQGYKSYSRFFVSQIIYLRFLKVSQNVITLFCHLT